MVGTILSIIVAVFFALHAYEVPNWVLPFGSPFFLVCSLFLLFVAFLGTFLVWQPLVRVQNKVMACAQELFFKDMLLRSALIYLFAFPLFSLYLTLAIPTEAGLGAFVLVYVWVIAFGIAFDLLRAYLKRAFSYTYTPFLVQKLTSELDKSVKNNEETKAFEWFEIAIESAARATHSGQIRLAASSLNALQTLIETYVKELAHQELLMSYPQVGTAPTFLDKVNYLCIFISERLQWVFETALRERMQPISDAVISEFGKMSVFFTRHNSQVASIPISFLMKCAELAQSADQSEVVTRAALTLSETTKSLLAYAKERNESIRDLIITTILTLEQLVKMTFKQNKNINVALLMQPFAEVGEFIGADQMRVFPDRDEVIKEIRRILTEFQALQVVAKNVEAMGPILAEDTTSSYQQDMPYTR